ncbi:MAG: glycosyltransferase family 4 protein [Thermoproteota archaeon]
MNILMLSHIPLQEKIGMATHISYLKEFLQKEGINVHLITPQLETHDLLSVTPQLLNASFEYIKIGSVDIVHAHFVEPSGLCSYLLNLSTGKPYIITLHGGDVRYLIKPNNRKDLYRAVLMNSFKIVSVSEALVDEASSWLKIPREKFVVIPNGVDPDLFKPSPENSSIKNKYNVDGPLVLYVGRLWYNKGLHLLLLAFKSVVQTIESAKLLVVGDGPLRNELVNVARRLNLMNNVVFVGEVDNKELPNYYNSCDVFALPSVFEGQGIAALEAMSCGKPVVAFNVGGIPEVVEDGKTGFLVKPYSIKDFSESIIKLLKDPGLRKAMGIEGRKVAEQKFQWKNIVKQLINVYLDALYSTVP